ncbi:hypothetical protein EVAR_31974_1 [Eumeta japonica]|uniref:Uncharacterized protein n=1 Tax=Eumeta variegata TaxID=151549 RepID=A0A4C1VTL2_EUMVA|nr:hypothetical protein EVAR_31974_1 [Eumeta japonica]
MFSFGEGCGCVSFRGGRRARSLGDDSSSCRSSEIEQEVPKRLTKKVLNGECNIKTLVPFLKFWRRDDVSMTKAERTRPQCNESTSSWGTAAVSTPGRYEVSKRNTRGRVSADMYSSSHCHFTIRVLYLNVMGVSKTCRFKGIGYYVYVV